MLAQYGARTTITYRFTITYTTLPFPRFARLIDQQMEQNSSGECPAGIPPAPASANQEAPCSDGAQQTQQDASASGGANGLQHTVTKSGPAMKRLR